MRILGSTYYGTRHVTTTNKEVKSAAQMAGFKIRVPENDVFKAMAEAWGAKPTPMNFNELYLALKQGVVDGQENPLPTIKSGKFDEVQKYIVLTGHIMTPRFIVVNEAFWQKIKPEDRKVVEDAVKSAISLARRRDHQGGKESDRRIQGRGVTIIEPDLESFRKPVMATVPAKFEAKWGKGTFERIANVEMIAEPSSRR